MLETRNVVHLKDRVSDELWVTFDLVDEPVERGICVNSIAASTLDFDSTHFTEDER